MAPTASREYLCCLPRVPVLPLTSTCCLPRLPQLRGGSWKSTGVIFGVSNVCEARQREPEICFITIYLDVASDLTNAYPGSSRQCELEPLWLAADMAERAQIGRVHI